MTNGHQAGEIDLIIVIVLIFLLPLNLARIERLFRASQERTLGDFLREFRPGWHADSAKVETIWVRGQFRPMPPRLDYGAVAGVLRWPDAVCRPLAKTREEDAWRSHCLNSN